MRVIAALAFGNRDALRNEEIELSEPAQDEVLVRIAATGLCHTDLTLLEHAPLSWPAILGHEGAGTVVAVGSAVRQLAPGDRVVTTFSFCGQCVKCRNALPSQCLSFAALNMSGGRRPDGSCTHLYHGKPAFGAFLGQSSFATHTLVKEASAVKLPDDFPLDLAAPLGCGIQTGAGGVLNTLRPEPGSSLAVFGAGAVGMAALMAAKASGCTTLIAVDRSAARLALASELGATHTLEASAETAKTILALTGGGVDHVVEAAGVAMAMTQAIESLAVGGTVVLLGIAPGLSIPVDPTMLQRRSITIKAVTMTEAAPQVFIPRLVRMHRAGLLPYERLVTYYDFENINQAMDDARSGAAIKPIIRMP